MEESTLLQWLRKFDVTACEPTLIEAGIETIDDLQTAYNHEFVKKQLVEQLIKTVGLKCANNLLQVCDICFNKKNWVELLCIVIQITKVIDAALQNCETNLDSYNQVWYFMETANKIIDSDNNKIIEPPIDDINSVCTWGKFKYLNLDKSNYLKCFMCVQIEAIKNIVVDVIQLFQKLKVICEQCITYLDTLKSVLNQHMPFFVYVIETFHNV